MLRSTSRIQSNIKDKAFYKKLRLKYSTGLWIRLGYWIINGWQGSFWIVEAATKGVLWKEVSLEISQNSQRNTCAIVSFLTKLHALGWQLYWKRDFGAGVFPWILQSFKEHLFYKTPLDDCFLSKQFSSTSFSDVVETSKLRTTTSYLKSLKCLPYGLKVLFESKECL